MKDYLKREEPIAFEVGNVIKGMRAEDRNKLFEVISIDPYDFDTCNHCPLPGCVRRERPPKYIMEIMSTEWKNLTVKNNCPANFVIADKREELLFRTHGSNILLEKEDGNN